MRKVEIDRSSVSFAVYVAITKALARHGYTLTSYDPHGSKEIWSA